MKPDPLPSATQTPEEFRNVRPEILGDSPTSYSAKNEARDSFEYAVSDTNIPTMEALQWGRKSDAIQDIFTILPLFVAVLLALMAIASNSIWVFLITGSAVSFAAAGTSFFWRYSVRDARVYADRLRELIIQEDLARKDQETQTLLETRDTLRTGFTSIGSDEGIRELERMVNEFDQLQDALSRWPKSSIVSAGHIPTLAEKTYREGLNVLSSVLELLMSIEVSDKKGLEIDVKALEGDIQVLQADETQSIRLELRVARLAELEGRLEILSRQEIRAEEFLLRSSLIEGALNRARIELASLRVDSSQGSVNAVSEELQKTIDRAREVLEEMRELGF